MLCVSLQITAGRWEQDTSRNQEDTIPSSQNKSYYFNSDMVALPSRKPAFLIERGPQQFAQKIFLLVFFAHIS